MNQPEDKGANPKPPDKPEGGVWLPPRLRDKLAEPTSGGEEFDFLKRKSSPVGTIITVIVIVAVVAGAWWTYQNNQNNQRKAAAAKAAAERAAFVADSLAKVRLADSLAAVVRADSIAFAALPKWKQRKILAEKAKQAAVAAQGSASPAPWTAGGSAGGAAGAPGGASAPAAGGATAGAGAAAGASGAAGSTAGPAETPEEAGPFGIDAGQYLDEARAGEVAASLKTQTGLSATVVSMGEGDELAYHVVLGSFSRRGAAESKANSLLAKALLSQAAVVALPKAP